MLTFDRSRHSATGVDAVGNEYVLVSQRLSIALNLGWGGLGASYTHPVAVIRHGVQLPLRDAVFIARLAALLAVSVAAFIATVRR